MKSNSNFIKLEENNLIELNGGGVGGFIVGYMIGTAVGYVAAPVMAACGGTQEECEQVLLSCVAIGAALGSMSTGPV